MATAVPIPIEELSDEARALVERASASGNVLVAGKGVNYKISRVSGRTTTDALELINKSPNAEVEVDEDWSKDMEEIIALRYSETYRDPWV